MCKTYLNPFRANPRRREKFKVPQRIVEIKIEANFTFTTTF